VAELRGRSFQELWVRGKQGIGASGEKYGLSRQTHIPRGKALYRLLNSRMIGSGSPTPGAVLDHFRTRTFPCFFEGCSDPDATVQEWRRRWPAAAARTVEQADRIVSGRFDLLGYTDLWFGDPIDWHYDPISGKRAPIVHWSRIDHLDPDAVGDHKVIWELNRHQHLAALGRAYWYTRNERYSQAFARHLLHWMAQNPPKVGINWVSSLEIALRTISWLWGLYFFRRSEELTPALFQQILGFLYLHARHLEAYLSTYYSPNTHLTGEALGLFYLGLLLPEFRESVRWLETGRRILMQELDRQVRADGVYFEQSSYYHRYTVEFYSHLLALMQANRMPVSPALQSRLIALLDYMMYVTKPDGTTPLFGDDDGGRLVVLDDRPRQDFRASLSTGAVLFSRGDYKHVAGGPAEETLWLLGATGVHAFDALPADPPTEASRGFAAGGYYVMRDGWARTSNYMLIDCGPHGALSGGHAHADALSFELAACGRSVLLDPGTYTYVASASMRDHFRSSSAHNTLTVDGQSSSAPGGPFAWRYVAKEFVRTWICRRRFDFFDGMHDGFARLNPPAWHRRRVLFLKGDYWVLWDQVTGTGTHHCELHFHFAPAASPTLHVEGDAAVAHERPREAPGVDIFTFGIDQALLQQDGLVSCCYGALAPAPVLTVSRMAQGPQGFITFLVPWGAATQSTRVERVSSSSGHAFDLSADGRRDLLLLSDGRAVETGRCRSDFDLAWLRLMRDGNGIEEMVLLGGHRLSFDGRVVLEGKDRIEHLTAFRRGAALTIEADGNHQHRWSIRSAPEAELGLISPAAWTNPARNGPNWCDDRSQ
jgi:hypothetical protein